MTVQHPKLLINSKHDTANDIRRTIRDSVFNRLSAGEIAELTGFSKSTVRNYIRPLVESGEVVVTGKVGQAKMYAIPEQIENE